MSTDIYAVIVAGGQGTRMGAAIPKQFLEIRGKPVLYYTLKAFTDAFPQLNIILVLPQNQFSYLQMVLQHFPERIDISLVAGGQSRFQSVRNGLQQVPPDAIVMVHDGVRPLASTSLLQKCAEQAADLGSAIPAVQVQDSIRTIKEDRSFPVDRSQLRSIQTPQAFKASILLPAFKQEESPAFTDEATVVEASGEVVHLIEGERSNLKITTPEDLVLAEALLKSRNQL